MKSREIAAAQSHYTIPRTIISDSINQEGTQGAFLLKGKYYAEWEKKSLVLDFHSEKLLTFKMGVESRSGKNGYVETVEIQSSTIRSGLYFIGWKEKNGTTVSHVEDHNLQLLYSSITMPDGSFHTATGTISPMFKTARKSVIICAGSCTELTGRTFVNTFKSFTLAQHFRSDDRLVITPLAGKLMGQPAQLVRPIIKKICPEVYLITWQEPNWVTVSQVFDLGNGKVYSKVTLPDKKFLNLEGKTALQQNVPE